MIFAHGWAQVFAAIAILVPLGFLAGVDTVMRISPLYALTLPLAAVIFTYMLARSTFITLKQGGILWRGTFYSLAELRRGRGLTRYRQSRVNSYMTQHIGIVACSAEGAALCYRTICVEGAHFSARTTIPKCPCTRTRSPNT